MYSYQKIKIITTPSTVPTEEKIAKVKNGTYDAIFTHNPAEIEKWFSPESSAYGAKMSQACGNADLQKIVNLMITACDRTLFEWKSEIAFFTIER